MDWVVGPRAVNLNQTCVLHNVSRRDELVVHFPIVRPISCRCCSLASPMSVSISRQLFYNIVKCVPWLGNAGIGHFSQLGHVLATELSFAGRRQIDNHWT